MERADWILLTLAAVNLAFFCFIPQPINLIAAVACGTVIYIRQA